MLDLSDAALVEPEGPEEELLRGTAVAVMALDSFWVMVLATDVSENLDIVDLFSLEPENDEEVGGAYKFADSDYVWEMPRTSIFFVFDQLGVDLHNLIVEGELGADQWAEASDALSEARRNT